ncbi:MAG: SOS response-associated peptidase family protein [Erythrobacter sp.]|nr:SOS response-associated peptidase family protein [Erythrobacter sp.]
MLYRLDAGAQAVAARFGITAGDDPWTGGHVAPGQFAPVITAGREFIAGPGGSRQPWRMVPRLWGVPPPPSAHDAARPVTSVRNVDSPFWVGNLRNPEFRCLVPATSFMEWGAGTDYEGRRLQHWFACAQQPVFAMAGVWKDSEVPGFALLTCPAKGLAKATGREVMPAILPAHPGAWATWLHGGWDRAQALLTPGPDAALVEVLR